MTSTLLEKKTDIFFDLDHTLWDFERNSALAFDQVLRERNLPFTIEDFLSFYVEINHRYWDEFSLNLISREELRVGRIRDTFLRLNYNSDTQEIIEVGDQYLKYLPEYNHLYEGAVDLLDYLKPKYQLHIITNGFSEVQAKKLAMSGIDKYFNTVTDSEVADAQKPDTKIFAYALHQANAIIDHSIMIGDNLMADIGGASKIGMDAIFFNEHKKEVPSDILQVHTLTAIKNLL